MKLEEYDFHSLKGEEFLELLYNSIVTQAKLPESLRNIKMSFDRHCTVLQEDIDAYLAACNKILEKIRDPKSHVTSVVLKVSMDTGNTSGSNFTEYTFQTNLTTLFNLDKTNWGTNPTTSQRSGYSQGNNALLVNYNKFVNSELKYFVATCDLKYFWSKRMFKESKDRQLALLLPQENIKNAII